jgi:hypothetical protein
MGVAEGDVLVFQVPKPHTMPLTNEHRSLAVRFGPDADYGVGEAGDSVVLPPLPPTVHAADPVQQHVMEVRARTIDGVMSEHHTT